MNKVAKLITSFIFTAIAGGLVWIYLNPGVDLEIRGENLHDVCVVRTAVTPLNKNESQCDYYQVFETNRHIFYNPKWMRIEENPFWFHYSIDGKSYISSCKIKLERRNFYCVAEIYLSRGGIKCGTCDKPF
jgi:hypothetical protein